ncbi:MAG: hypothetical protein ACRDRM_06235 [Pseudonocardiaceae bacterium]
MAIIGFLTRCRRVLGDDHLATLRTANNLTAAALRAVGADDQASQLEKLIRSHRRDLP